MRVMIVVAMLMQMTAFADADRRFEQIRSGSEALGSLSTFLQKYIGDCGALNPDCAKNAETFRKIANRTKYYMVLGEETASLLQVGEVNVTDGTFILNFTPFVAAGGSAVSHGAPTKTDNHGNPILPFIRIDSTLPDGWTPALMSRQVQGQALRLQLVFTPEGLWTLPRKAGAPVKGVRARFEGILVQVVRSGENIGTWFARDH